MAEMASTTSPLLEALSEIGIDVVSARPLSGGDNARALRLELTDGRTVFAKTQPDAPQHTLTTEAAGLGWLAETRAIRVPDVLAVSDGHPADGQPNFLVLEWIDEANARSGTPSGSHAIDEDFGNCLAALHRIGAPTFGRTDRRPTGSRGLPNEPMSTWSEFYATQRLVPLARLAAESRALAPQNIAALERLARRLDEVGGDPEPPARLHGDLWAGNRLIDQSGANWLVDPAAHGGHREFDLAMMRLFGGFGEQCFSAYDEAFPLAPGWRDRVALHQVAPLVVHAIKFGGGYRDAASRAIAQYV